MSEPSEPGPGEPAAPAPTGAPTGREQVAHALPSDVETVAALAEGDQQALRLLYERYASRAYSLARRICCEEGLAEEVVQEAFLALWRTPTSYDSCASTFATWLLTVVHHKAVDVVRREQVRRRAPLASAEECSPPTGPDVAALATERAELVQEALRRLPVEQRRVLMLAYYGGYTQREISELTAAPLGTVKSRMFTALHRLQIMLA